MTALFASALECAVAIAQFNSSNVVSEKCSESRAKNRPRRFFRAN